MVQEPLLPYLDSSEEDQQLLPEPLPRTRGIVTAVVLLSTSSGLVDAVVYTLHGHVFAFAMTGNLVLLGVAVGTRNASEILHHALPIAGLLAGVLLGKALLRFQQRLALTVTVLLQMLVLTLCGAFAQQLPQEVLVSALAISGAVLITTVRRVGDIPFNITFMTGNLRAVAEGAFDAVFPRQTSPAAHGALQFQVVGLACCGFLTGAAIGALTLRRLQNHTFWIADLLLLAAAWLLRKANPAPEV